MPGKFPNSIVKLSIFSTNISALLVKPFITLKGLFKSEVKPSLPRFLSSHGPFHLPRTVKILSLLMLLICSKQVWAENARVFNENPDRVRPAERLHYALMVANRDAVTRMNVRLQDQVPAWVRMDEDITLLRNS